MQDRTSSVQGSPPRQAPRRLLLVSASLAIGASIWFMLDDPDSLVAEESPAGPSTPDVVARVQGVEITETEVEATVAEELRELEETRRRLVEEAVERRIHELLLESAARAEGSSVGALLEREVDSKLHLVSTDELAAATGGEPADPESELELRRTLRLARYLESLRDRADVVRYVDLPTG